jgi:hypothetical protein
VRAEVGFGGGAPEYLDRLGVASSIAGGALREQVVGGQDFWRSGVGPQVLRVRGRGCPRSGADCEKVLVEKQWILKRGESQERAEL